MDHSTYSIHIELYKYIIDQTIPSVNKHMSNASRERPWKLITKSIFHQILMATNSAEHATIETISESNPNFNLPQSNTPSTDHNNELDVYSGIQHEEEITIIPAEEQLPNNLKVEYDKTKLDNIEYLKKNFYTIDNNQYGLASINLPIDILNAPNFSKQDFRINLQNTKEPRILIFHTHSQENFIDSRPGVEEDTIVGVGNKLADILQNQYNISTLHYKEKFDVMADGSLDRSKAYDKADIKIPQILKQYPSIEVVIDLHRDGIPEEIKLLTDMNGKPTAKIMFVNGICKYVKNGQLIDYYLQNPYLEDNMALAFQMQLKANELYPTLMRKIYVKALRYTTHMKPRSLLIEAGAQTNTKQEVINAMEPLAEILVEVLQK